MASLRSLLSRVLAVTGFSAVAITPLLTLLPAAAPDSTAVKATVAPAVPATSSAAVQRDVSFSWDYACLTGDTCALSWTQKPLVSFGISFDSARAQRAYATIPKWRDFQYQFLTAAGGDFKSIVYSQDIFDNYYLPPHSASGAAKEQWEKVYAATNPVVQKGFHDAYDATVGTITGNYLVYRPSFARLPVASGANLQAGGADQDYARLLTGLADKNAVVPAETLKNLVFDALYEGQANVPDLTAPLQDALLTALQKATTPHARQFADYQGLVSAEFAITQTARLELDTAAEQQNFDRVQAILRTVGARFLSTYPNADSVRKLLAYNWTGQQIAERLTDALLKSKFEAVTYAPTAVTSAQALADELFNFGTAIYRLDTVSRANNYEPPSGADGTAFFYGPRFVASLSTQISYLANLGQMASSVNPDLPELYDQYKQLIETGKFSAADLAQYWQGTLEDLFSQQDVKDNLIKLVEKAVKANPDNQALKDALAKIRNEGLNASSFAPLFDQLNLLLEASSRVTSYVFIALGAAVTAVAATASYSLVRGYRAKRKYGTTMLEYTMSKRMLVFVALVAGVVGVSLVAIAAAGVL